MASCIFYGAWDWRFLFLMFTSITTDYFCALKIYETDNEKRRKRFLFFSIFVNLSILGFFKYFDFFLTNLQALLAYFGVTIPAPFLKIILPVGISFYTFQTMSYTLDVYRSEMAPSKNFLDYALFVTYFPQLVAGPIMRARDLLPQVLSARKISLDKFYEGCYLIFWGLFQKVFVADNLAKIVDAVFTPVSSYNGVKVLLGLYAFAFQILCDFSGYSDIARGLGKCMGFEIMVNFNLPYFATNPREFWQRWHISLSTWLRDYLYIPLGGNRKGALMAYRNLAITMFLGGLWHGAAWTFVIWGSYHAALLIIHRFFGPLFKKTWYFRNLFLEKIWFGVKVILFFHLVCLGWLIFRAQSMAQAFQMLAALIKNFSIGSLPEFGNILERLILYIWIFAAVQIFQYRKNDLLVVLKSNVFLRAAFYIICYFLLITHGSLNGKAFIYFQF